tara:strand:- start:327 stop:569 length:243 start_codon:yes stop_codon:yes gene_type:complete
MIKAVDRMGVEQKFSLCFSLSQCSIPIPTNKFSVMPPCTPQREIALRKENYAAAHNQILLKQGIIYSERVGKNKKLGEKK